MSKKLKSPINNIQQLMAITSEECGELTQVCMKIMRKYDSVEGIEKDKKYRTKLIEEAGDVLCMLELLAEHDIVDWQELYDRADVKRSKLKTWSTLINDEN